MPFRPETQVSSVIRIGATSTDLVAADDVWQEVRNFRANEEGAFSSISDPIPLMYDEDGIVPGTGMPSTTGPVYGPTSGVFHARVHDGHRDLLLLQTGNQIWELQGWNRSWRCLIGKAGTAPGAAINADLPKPAAADFPTQWCATPTGVVMIPPGGRAYFYDGHHIAKLGYERAPGAPVGLGPDSSSTSWFPDPTIATTGINDTGYVIDGLSGTIFETHPILKMGRVGTVATPGNVSVLAEGDEKTNEAQVMGYLEPGRYRACVQYVDLWGNLSPLSPASNDIRFARQPSMGLRWFAPEFELKWETADAARKQIAWTSINPGPPGTIGRIVYRTKDLENAGDPNWYELPRDATVTPGAFATMPDNMSTAYTDNIPDAWLVAQPTQVREFPQARLCTMAFGRLWIANAPSEEGALWWSLQGRWGTIGLFNKMFPDPTGSSITGLARVNSGLLAMCNPGIYLITENDSGDGFRSSSINASASCVAPSSIATMRNGVTIWLGRDGFYGYNGTSVEFMWGAHRRWGKRLNRARMSQAVACFDPTTGEYRCWVAYEGSEENNLCFTFDGVGWRLRDDISATGVCVTADHRQLVIASGAVEGMGGVWVLDHAGEPLEGSLKTGWVRAQDRSQERASVRTVHLWIRERGSAAAPADKILIKTRSDWRSEVVGTERLQPYPAVATGYGVNPSQYGVDKYNSATATWRVRRPFWVKVDIAITAAEVFQLEFSSSRAWEVLGYSFEEQERSNNGAFRGRG